MTSNQALRIIFIAFNENSLGRRILSNMVYEGIIPLQTLMASPTAVCKYRISSIKRYFQNNDLGNTIWRIIYRLTRCKDVRTTSLKNDPTLNHSIKEFCKKNNIPLDYFDNINHNITKKKIVDLKPDLIILGGAPILKQEIISIPRIAVLNSHPGILPDAKGMDVVAQSILYDIPLGATVFKVNAGIDSGAILLKEYLSEKLHGLKLEEIEAKVEALCSTAMIKGIKMVEKGQFEFHPQNGQGKIFKSLSYNKYKQVKAKLKLII